MSIFGSSPTRFLAPGRAAPRRILALLAALLLPATLLAQLPYATDPLFQGGRFEPDAHAVALENGEQGSIARRVARIGSTDFAIQASLVKHPSGTQGNGYWNIGLMRFGINTGNRFAWSNATANFSHFNNEYLIFPNVATASYADILAVSVIGDDILVLADVFTSSGGRDVRIVRFSLTGQYRGFIDVFNSTAEEYAGDMISYQSGLIGDNGGDQIMVVGARLQGGVSTPVFRRYQLTQDDQFIARTNVVQLDGAGCRSATDCRPRKLALGFRGLVGTPAVFVAGRIPSPDWRTTIMRVNTNGVTDATWNPDGYVLNLGAVGDGDEAAVGIVVRTSGTGLSGSPYADLAFVAVAVERGCTPGVAIARVSIGMSSALVRNFGGSDPSGGICLLSSESHYPRALALNGDQLIVVGRADLPSILIGGSTRINSFVAALDSTNMGSAIELQRLEWPIGGPHQRHSVLNDVIAAPDNALIAVGDIRYTDAASVPVALRNKVQSGRVKFRRLAAGIFADGFE